LSEVPQVLATFAGLAVAESQPLRALRLAGGTHALRRAQGAGLQPREQAQMEHQLAPARRMLANVAASQAWAEGEAMTLDELVACALEEPLPKPLLTRREQEVAGLLGRGDSNREIAAALVISEGTAEVHVKHILAKLGFTARGQITAWAVREGMDRPLPTIPAEANANT
jgi:DNA-binding NarL/FixJ family response regulator